MKAQQAFDTVQAARKRQLPSYCRSAAADCRSVMIDAFKVVAK
jgi:hypothetical protein